MAETTELVDLGDISNTPAQRPRQVPMWVHVVGGELAGMAGILVSQPFDTIKTIAQNSPNKHAGTVAKELLQTKGVVGLYRGMLSPLLGQGVMWALLMGVNGNTQQFLKNHHGRDLTTPGAPLAELMLTGAWAGLVSTVLRTPIERVKCWSQMHNTGTIESTKTLLRQFGIRKGLYQGTNATIVREVGQFGIYYAMYEVAMEQYLVVSGASRETVPSHVVVACGGLVGALHWVPTISLDVIKTRFQSSVPGTYTSWMSCARTVWREAGWAGLCSGLVPAMARAAPMHGAIWLTYEKFVNLMCS